MRRSESRVRYGVWPWRGPLVLLAIITVLGLLGRPCPAQADQKSDNPQHYLDPALGAYLPAIGLKGKLVIVGSETMQQLLMRLSSGFRKWHPDVTISVETEGSLAGFGPFLEWSSSGGAADRPNVAMLLAYSNPIPKERANEFATKVGYAPMEMQVALGAVAIYVHETNPLRELTLEQLDGMFGASRKRGVPTEITKWGQVGLRGQWEQKPVHLYGRDRQSGTRTLFKRVALLDGEFKASVREESGANSLVLAISNDPLAVGYAGVVFQDLTTVRVVPLAETAGKPALTPTAATVGQGTYPMSRKLYLYVNKAPGQELLPVVLEFLKFANSRDGQEVVLHAGFYPAPMTELTKNLALLATRRPEK